MTSIITSIYDDIPTFDWSIAGSPLWMVKENEDICILPSLDGKKGFWIWWKHLTDKNLYCALQAINKNNRIVTDAPISKTSTIISSWTTQKQQQTLQWYANPAKHPILNKKGFLEMMTKHASTDELLPQNILIDASGIKSFDSFVKVIGEMLRWSFKESNAIVIKHPEVDGAWAWVGVIYRDQNIEQQLRQYCEKIAKKINKNKIFSSWFVVQEFIVNSAEGSFTVDIQNDTVHSLGLSLNTVENWRFIGASNYFDGNNEWLSIELLQAFSPLIKDLQAQWVRGNIGFDMMFSPNKAYAVEANGIFRPTGSTMANNFARNYKKESFLWTIIPNEYFRKDINEKSLSGIYKRHTAVEEFNDTPGIETVVFRDNINPQRVLWTRLWIASNDKLTIEDINSLNFLTQEGKDILEKITATTDENSCLHSTND